MAWRAVSCHISSHHHIVLSQHPDLSAKSKRPSPTSDQNHFPLPPSLILPNTSTASTSAPFLPPTLSCCSLHLAASTSACVSAFTYALPANKSSTLKPSMAFTYTIAWRRVSSAAEIEASSTGVEDAEVLGVVEAVARREAFEPEFWKRLPKAQQMSEQTYRDQ